MRNEILEILNHNGRMGTRELAAMLDADETEIVSEIEEMEKENVIYGYNALIDWGKTGNTFVTAMIEVNVAPHGGTGFDNVANRICNYPEVTSVYLISGSYDLLVCVNGKTLEDVARFVSAKLSTLEDVTGTKTNFLLKKYKDNGFIIENSNKDERMSVSP